MNCSRHIMLSLFLTSLATGAFAGSLASGPATGVPGRVHMTIGHLSPQAPGTVSTHYSMGEAYAKYLWPKVGGVATVYYVIDAGSDPDATPKIDTAVSTFNADFSGIIQWTPWTSSDGPNYVDINLSADNFSGQCEANEGYEAIPAQPMNGSTSCTVATILHEMGHIIGLWHEQSRPDAATYVTVNYGNVIKGSWGNFEQLSDDIQLLTPYDYASIMQYPPYSFSRNGGPVIETIPAGIPLGGEGLPQAESADYSAADKEAIERLYGAAPTKVTVTSNPAGLEVVVDGETITTPQQFTWALNSTHTLSVPSGVQTLNGDIENSTTTATFYYTYGRWNDSAGQTHTITVDPGNGSPAFPNTSPQVATYSANFIQLAPYTATVYPTGEGTVAVSPQPQTYSGSDSLFFVARQQATLTATPSTGWNFYEFNNGPFWLPGGLGANPKTFYVPDTGNPVNTTAEFTNNPVFTVDVQPDAFSSNLSVYVDGNFWYTPKNFSLMYDSTWTTGSNHTINATSPQYPYSVNSRYVFSSWNIGGSASTTIDSLPASSTSYVATMTPEYAPATNFNYPPCGGTATISPSSPGGDGFYPTGQKLTFNASPDSGWTFSGWTYDLTGKANPATLTPSDESLVFSNFNIANAPLSLSTISPSTVRAGAASFTLILAGTGFAPGSLVSVNGIYRTVTYVNSTELKVTVNASDVNSPGGFQVFVENFPAGWDGCAVFGYQTFMVKGALISQTITFPSIGQQPALTSVTPSATSSSGLPVTYSTKTSTICSISGSTVSLLIPGTCTVTASQAGNSDYAAAANASRNIVVMPAPQTIDFPMPAAQTALSTLPLSATASSGLTVSFTSLTPTYCTVSGESAAMIQKGTCTIQASQPGNSIYAAAPKVSRSFVVNHAPQTISFSTIASHPALSTVTLSASATSGLAVSFTSLTPSVCTVSGNSASLLEHGSCTIQASQAGNNVYGAAPEVDQGFGVSYLSQTITFASISQQTVNTTITLSAEAGSGLPVTFTTSTPTICTVTGSSLTLNATGICTVDAHQTGNNIYSAAPTVGRNIQVVPAS